MENNNYAVFCKETYLDYDTPDTCYFHGYISAPNEEVAANIFKKAMEYSGYITENIVSSPRKQGGIYLTYSDDPRMAYNIVPMREITPETIIDD